jgi:hypothetical protein
VPGVKIFSLFKMKGKKGLSALGNVGAAVLVLVILVSILYIWGKYGIGTGKKIGEVGEIGTKQDTLCISSTRAKALTYRIRDIDNDDRDDQTCDWCVCESGCNNDDDDRDGDKLPDRCDAEPDNINVVRFNENNCPEGNLVNLAGENKQCRPS